MQTPSIPYYSLLSNVMQYSAVVRDHGAQPTSTARGQNRSLTLFTLFAYPPHIARYVRNGPETVHSEVPRGSLVSTFHIFTF